MWKTVGNIFAVFLPLSFLTIGGGQAIIAETQRQVVSVHHWLTRTEFVDIFAISRMSPGPGSLYITLIGWRVAGFWGAVAATIAIFGPSILLTYVIAGFWSRFENAHWQRALEQGLKPVASGMILASVYVLLTTLGGAPWAQAIALASTALLYFTRINPLLLLASGGGVFLLLHNVLLV
jgi:chromate transporter